MAVVLPAMMQASSSVVKDSFSSWATDQRFGPFISSMAMIVCSELGDKTFFIAAIMSMKHSHFAVFWGAAGALYVMTVLSVSVGAVLPRLLNPYYTHLLTVVMFICFGCRLLYEAVVGTFDTENAGALVEAEESFKSRGDNGSTLPPPSIRTNVELKRVKDNNTKEDALYGNAFSKSRKGVRRFKRTLRACVTCGRRLLVNLAGPVFFQAFYMTFIAEWGDRSQLATIALAATHDATGIAAGACVGHSLCTGLAVIGGRLLASRISERAVTYCGGILFLLFGVVELIVY